MPAKWRHDIVEVDARSAGSAVRSRTVTSELPQTVLPVPGCHQDPQRTRKVRLVQRAFRPRDGFVMAAGTVVASAVMNCQMKGEDRVAQAHCVRLMMNRYVWHAEADLHPAA
jgi:hypothetical protein